MNVIVVLLLTIGSLQVWGASIPQSQNLTLGSFQCPLMSVVNGFELSKSQGSIQICPRCNTSVQGTCVLSKVFKPPMTKNVELIICPSGQMAMKEVSSCLIWQRKFCIEHVDEFSAHVDFVDEPYTKHCEYHQHTVSNLHLYSKAIIPCVVLVVFVVGVITLKLKKDGCKPRQQSQ